MNSVTHAVIATLLESTMGSHCTVQVRGLSPGKSPNLRKEGNVLFNDALNTFYLRLSREREKCFI